jgi:pimeloyl-ACP methyl ester carboxylesterase
MNTCVVALATLALALPSGKDALRRRADLGADLSPPTSSSPCKVARIDPASALFAAGLRTGDAITQIGGRAIEGPIDFDRRIAALRGGDRVRFTVSRAGASVSIDARLSPMIKETIEGADVEYTSVVNPRGPRQRVIVSRPRGRAGRLPAILFVPWLSCDSIETPVGMRGGIEQLLHHVAMRSGFVLMRVEKPGAGDSEGVCGETDFDTELEGERAAFEMLRRMEGVDADRMILMGHSFAGAFLPLVAKAAPVAGYIFIDSWMRTWFERLIEFERLALERANTPAAEVHRRMRSLIALYALILEGKKTPKEAFAVRPDLFEAWSDEPEHQYGRPIRFYQQLEALDPADIWSKVQQPTLVIWGDADIIMHREDHERLVRLIDRNRPNTARLVVVPGMDHGMLARDASGARVLPAQAVEAVDRFLAEYGGPS